MRRSGVVRGGFLWRVVYAVCWPFKLRTVAVRMAHTGIPEIYVTPLMANRGNGHDLEPVVSSLHSHSKLL